MVKEIIYEYGRAFGEFSLLTDYSDRECTIPNINLETKLAHNLILKIPLISAAMTSVTGYEMALALGKEGGLGVLPASLPIEEQANIVRRIKNYEMSFVEEPLIAKDNYTIEEVLKLVENHGHAKIPIVDRNNIFKGIFLHSEYWKMDVNRQENVCKVMVPFNKNGEIPYTNIPEISVDDVKDFLRTNNQNYLVVLDDQNRLVKLAFKKDVEKIKLGAAISTHLGWQERVHANLEAGVDLVVIDSSDGYSEFTRDVIVGYKNMKIDIPICAGNVITYEGARFLMETGADIVKVGMSSGSICTTQREKAVGRGPVAALVDCDKARYEFFKFSGKYVPLIIDGGISGAADIILALTMADAVMMGNWFNRFLEAAGEKLDKYGKPTRNESEIVYVGTWGEASNRARNLDRYGHSSMKTFFEEGIEGYVEYEGRLKPVLKGVLVRIKGGIANTGAKDLRQFRAKARIELNSPFTTMVVSNIHDVKTRLGDKD